MLLVQLLWFKSVITALGMVLRNISTILRNGVVKWLPTVPCFAMLVARAYSLPAIPCRLHQAVRELTGGRFPARLPLSVNMA